MNIIPFLIGIVFLFFVSYFLYFQKKKIVYLYWTGGYDSTFRLCSLLLIDQLPVQPIYVASIIDNEKELTVRRRNQSQERQAMEHILSLLRERYPSVSHLLYPLQIVSEEIPYSDHVRSHMKLLHQQGLMRRPVCQYGALSQYALSQQKYIEICVEKDPNHSAMYKTVSSFVKDNGLLPQLPFSHPLSIFQNLCFSTIQYTKQDMLTLAKKYQFDDILSITWSCWYPLPEGKPCGKCIMCSDRIV